MTLAYGMAIGWASPTIPFLEYNENAPGGLMSPEGISWLTGVVCLAGCIITGFLGDLAERLGRKNLGYLIAMPMIISWLMIAYAQSHLWIYTARALAGFGGAGILFLAPIYVSEIASEDIRGVLGSLLVLIINTGILLGFVAGAHLSYRANALVSSTMPLVFLTTFYFMPETPIYLVRQNKLNEAMK